MNEQHNIILTTLFTMVLIAGAFASEAQADESKGREDAKELQLFSQAKISLTDAIKAAEQKTGGKAFEAELNDESDIVQFEIEILKDGKIHDVLVDGKTGKVLKVSLDDDSNDSTENEKE